MKSMDNRKGISPDDQNRQGSPSNLGNICGSSPSLELEATAGPPTEVDAEIDLREVYFLIMHFLSAGPCTRTYGQIWNELLEHQLLPRRYHAWFSRKGLPSGDENDDGLSLPLNYSKLVERYPHVGPDHLVKLLKQLLVGTPPPRSLVGGFSLSASDVPTLLGCGSISLLSSGGSAEEKPFTRLPSYLRWPHMQADQVHALSLREIGGGFTKHHRAPSIRAANYAIARPSTLLQKMEIIKKLRGHQNAVYCAIFDRTGRYVITGSDDRLVKIWSMETAFCLSSCRGHEGDITDLAVSSNNVLVASASNDFIIRVWRLPDGMPISVLRGHSGVVTAIAFSPRPSAAYQLLSSSDDGTCRIWDARASNVPPRVYIPKPPESMAGKSSDPIQTVNQRSNQILCCAFNANGTVFVTGSSDTYARVWNALKGNFEDPEQPNHELDVLSGHENDVNYVQFSGCAVASRNSTADATKEDGFPKFKNSWFAHDNIVTCSRDGSAIIWTPRSRRSHGKVGKWTRAYHLKVPPPPMPPQPTRGGPRQRFLPTPRGVNMIVWSLDNRFVLAAIMDCRICVWNAADGSLVHSLTGHTQSTYVLDVHPFNPRIAMSAGYDGKTIVWDIWEGVPVRTYEIGRFKLVDGKFSPDGTSIVLSDEVGQIYILATGQGEAQKDAMFDQFFLGDYRPLIQDAQGNVLDQETQLPPFRRNMQDLLCDYSLIPYPDPYQSMYQQRRLGALGFEWRPPSVSLAVGPADLSVGGVTDYRIYFPQVHLDGDLDRLFDQPTDLGDFIDWEPEVEVQSDDSDSEYNVTEESSEGEQGSLGASSCQDSMDDAEESDGEEMKNEHLRRSKRKKHKEVEIMTSFGRRVKRRNLDEHDVILPAHKKSKRRKNSHLPRKKGRSPKSSRPQRLAARNARNLFSRIGGTSSYGRDEEEEEREGEEEEEDDSPNDEALQHDTIVLDNEYKRRGVVVRPDEGTSVNAHHEKIDPEVKKTRRLVFKLPARDSNKVVPFENNTSISDVVSGTKSPVKELPEGTLLAGRHLNNQKQILVGESSGGGNFDSEAVVNDMIDSGPLEQNNTGFENVEGHHSSSGNKGSEIKWGEVKMRTSKRLRLGDGSLMDPWPSSDSKFSSADELAHGGSSNMSNPIQVDKIASEDSARFRISSPKSFDPVADCTSLKIQSGRADSPVLSNGVDGNSVLVHANDEENLLKCQSYLANGNGNHQDTEYHVKVSKNKISIPFKLKIRSKTMVSDSNIASSAVFDTSEVPSRCQETYCPNQNLEVGPIAHNRNSGEWDTSDEYHIMSDRDAGTSDQYGSSWSNSDGSKKVYTSVYKRSKLSRSKAEVDLDHNTHIGDAHVDMDNSDHNYKQEVASTSETVHRTRSMGLRSTRFTGEDHKSSSFRCRESHRTVRDAESLEPHNQYLHEESRPISRANVGVRSTRGKRGNFYNSEQGSFGRSSLPVRKLSWLLLYENEGGYRYIPQMGDEVAYLRQGHKEFLEQSRLHQKPPYIIYKDIRAFEFCKIIALDYSFLPSGDSCCKLTLEFVDPSSSVCGETFSLSLPELTDFPDFLVERTRFDASIARNWTHRDKCQVWWRSDGAEGGSWWEGRILSVKPKSIEYPDSPWERFVVQYKNESSEPHLHSPWELHEPGASSWEHPHIDPTSKTKLLSCFAKLERLSIEKQDQYGLLKLDQVSQKSDFFNRFPLPLSFDLIKRRLENGHYRSLEAVKHDLSVMLSNAESYFAKSAEMSAKMRRLSDWISILPL